MTDGAAVQGTEPRLRPRDWITVGLLFFGPFLLVLGWLVGVWLLWTSNRWSTVWKIVGTAAWPLGYATMLGMEFVQPPIWLSMLVGGVIEIAIYLALIKEARV
ncbi:MAG: hypothetical protein HOV67_36055 [Kribbellaceae bacterium]|nr:hypothetical protein [Kribbellaceae bacterium]